MRRSLSFSSLVLLVVTLGASTAFAQPRPTRPGPPEPTPVNPSTVPVTPDVNDPMLAPVPRPKTEVTKWEDALQYLRARSTDLRTAAQEVLQAEAQSRVALAAALFTLNGNATYTHQFITKDSYTFGGGGTPTKITTPLENTPTIGATLSQPVLALEKWYAIGTAHRNEDVARLSLQDTKRVIALAAANAIVGVVTAERVAELNRVGLKNALLRLELATRKTNLGSGTGLDVVRAKQDVETARATLVTGDESLRQAREALGLALGLPEQVGVPPSVDLNGLEASARGSCKAAKSVDERADVASLRENVGVAHRGIKDVQLQFVPTIDLRSTVSSALYDTGPGPYNTQWNIQAILTVPIWEGGARYGNMHAAEALEAIAGEKLEAQRRKAEIEVAQAQRGVSVAEAARKVALTARDLAAENDRLTRTAYLEGRGTSLELVTAAQGLRETEITLALREFDLVKARVLAVLALASCEW